MRVKLRRCQVIKLILTGFVVAQENIKPSVLMHRPRKLGLYFKDLGLYIFLYNTKPVSMRILLNICTPFSVTRQSLKPMSPLCARAPEQTCCHHADIAKSGNKLSQIAIDFLAILKKNADGAIFHYIL